MRGMSNKFAPHSKPKLRWRIVRAKCVLSVNMRTIEPSNEIDMQKLALNLKAIELPLRISYI